MDSIKQWFVRAGQRLSVRLVLLVVLVATATMLVYGQQGSGAGMAGPGYYFVRGLFTRFMAVDGYQTSPDINARGDLLIAQSLPERTEMVRLGNSWTIMDTTAVADVTAIPTTTASVTFWNGEPDGAKSYVVDRAFCTTITSAGAAGMHTLVGMVNKGPVAAPTAVSLTVSSLNGRNYPGKLVVARSATVTNDAWWALPGTGTAAGVGAATVTGPGLTIEAQLNGLVVLPPRHQMSLALVGIGSTETCKFGISWHEVQMPIVY